MHHAWPLLAYHKRVPPGEAYTTLKQAILAKRAHHVHPHNNQGTPGAMLAVTITHHRSHAMDLIIHYMSLNLTCRE